MNKTWIAAAFLATSPLLHAHSMPAISLDFESGLQGWHKTGTAFDQQPVSGDAVSTSRVIQLPLGGDYWRDLPYPIGHQGSFWIGTYENSQGDGPQGTLTSDPFVIQQDFLSFLISGGRDPQRLAVELVINDRDDKPVLSATGENSEVFRRVNWDVTAYRGKTAKLRIVDRSSDSWGHINVDDFRFSDEPQRPAERALWGFADLHTHPMSHLGFGQTLFAGEPDGNIAAALGSCECSHASPLKGGASCRGFIRSITDGQVEKGYKFQGLLDHPSKGYPDFKAWPHFTTITHQQMWHEWIRRAYDGGLRVMMALSVNNHLLAEVTGGLSAKDDKASNDLQLNAIKAFVGRHSDFMEIADSPERLRDIVSRDKLAVILGMEIDDIGNLMYRGTTADEAAVRAEIDRLYGEGVRYIFPVHLADNVIGGAAVYNDLFNLSNRFEAAQPLPPDQGAALSGTAFRVEHDPDSTVRFTLKPHLSGTTADGIRLTVAGIEHLPNPNLADIFKHPTIGSLLAGRKDYQIVKSYFLIEDPMLATYAGIPEGHRNVRGLTRLGEAAIDEIMRLGMMIDVDHMSEHSLDRVIEIADSVPGGYPLNSGHNSFRSLGNEDEGGRTDDQVARLQRLGGMMGLGWGYRKASGPGPRADVALAKQARPRVTVSNVAADCGGTTRRFAQDYLYAVERFGGRVALGTDTNGFVKSPGPRFGEDAHYDGNYCAPQSDPVVYADLSSLGGSANLPLKPLRTGTRVWDVNRDGAPHYGMVPDFLQDLRNVGVQPQDLGPLFRGAENVARMWERSLRAASSLLGRR